MVLKEYFVQLTSYLGGHNFCASGVFKQLWMLGIIFSSIIFHGYFTKEQLASWQFLALTSEELQALFNFRLKLGALVAFTALFVVSCFSSSLFLSGRVIPGSLLLVCPTRFDFCRHSAVMLTSTPNKLMRLLLLVLTMIYFAYVIV